MWTWMWWMGAALGFLVLAPHAGAQATAPEDPLEYGLFALESIRVGARAKIAGAVGVNDGEAALRRRSTVDGVVAADVIRFGRRARATDVVCTLVVGGTGTCTPFARPLVPSASLELVKVNPGVIDVAVPRRGRRVTLPAGSYRRGRVGRGASLTLDGGEYELDSLRLDRGASLTCASTCRIRVTRTLRVGARAAVEPLGGIDPTTVRIDVEGLNARRAVRVGSRTRLHGTLYAPTADVRLGRRVRVTGTVVAGALRTGSRLRVERP